jgi:hypothetical protein
MRERAFKKNSVLLFIVLNLFIFFFSVYLLTASGNNFYDADVSQLRIQVAKSILERNDLSVPLGIRGVDGRAYSWFGIGSVVLAIPFFALGKLIGVQPAMTVSIMNQLFGAATAVLIFLFSISLGYSRRASLLVSIFYGLGTIAWPMAKHPHDHIIEIFFILLSVYCVHLYGMKKSIYLLLFSAFSFGVAFIIRTTSVLILLPIGVLIFLNQKGYDFKSTAKFILRDYLLYFIVLLPFLALSFWYNYYRFGSVFETGYQVMAARFGISLFEGGSLMEGLSGFLVSPGKGYFFYSPIAILFFFAIKGFMKKNYGLGISFIFIILSYLFFYSMYIYWHGDWSWGPRYIFVITPFLIIPIVDLVERTHWSQKNFRKLAIYFIFVLSIIIQIGAVSVYFPKYYVHLKFIENVKVTKMQGDGVIPIFVFPSEIHFQWNRSPIIAHFKFIIKMSREIKEYRYLDYIESTNFYDRVKKNPNHNIFDFWWLYNYFLDKTYSGFIVALALLLLAFSAAIRLWKQSR